MRPPNTCDVFCRVIDNFGDIGVCWRFVRQLAREHAVSVRLFVDELSALQKLEPATQMLPRQHLSGIEVWQWPEDFPETSVADLVIEAFACELPATYLAALAMRPTPPAWINLEYLSAEAWVEGCHGLISLEPRTGLHKVFYFPGFTPATGGLLRESDLLSRRNHWRSQTAQQARFWQRIGTAPRPSERIISLFAYENPWVEGLLEALRTDTQTTLCLVPEGRILPEVARALGHDRLSAGEEIERDNLRVRVLPFLPQDAYDQLLWACDLNFVRGEDSFVRAQWAGRPMVWHIYPQEDAAHLVKLEAFLQRYCENLPSDLGEQIFTAWHHWNCPDSPHNPDWARLMANLPRWRADAEAWCQGLRDQGDLVAKMIFFLKNRL